MENLPKLDDSIYILQGLSERTYNALIKHGISHIGDFYKYKDDIRVLSEMRGIGNNAINELNEALSEFEGYRYFSLNGFFEKYGECEDNTEAINNPPEEIILPPFFKYNNLKYYINSPAFILFEDKKVRGAFMRSGITFNDLINIKNLGKIKGIGVKSIPDIKKVKDDILDDIISESKYSKNIKFSEINEIDIFMLLSNYYNNLSEAEKTIINQRLKWFTNLDNNGLTFRELGEKYGLTNERLRQIENSTISEFEYFIEFHSELLYNYFNNNLLNDKNIIGYKYNDLELLNHLSYDVLCIIFSKVFGKYGPYIFRYNNENQSYFFIRDTGILNRTQINDLLNVIDKKCLAKKSVPKHVIIKDLINNSIGNFENFHPEISEYAYQICKYHVEIYYGINVKSGTFDVVADKRNYGSIIMYELGLLKEPIHYKDLYQILCNKYPQFKRREKTILARFIENNEVVNVGKGLYIKKGNSMKGGTIIELAKDYLENLGKPIEYDKLVVYIQKNKIVKSTSIDSMIFKQSNNIFVRYYNGKVGLRKRHLKLPEWEKSQTFSDKMLEFFMNHKGEIISYQDLLDIGEFGNDINKIRNSVAVLSRNRKIKFIKKGKFRYFYYE